MVKGNRIPGTKGDVPNFYRGVNRLRLLDNVAFSKGRISVPFRDKPLTNKQRLGLYKLGDDLISHGHVKQPILIGSKGVREWRAHEEKRKQQQKVEKEREKEQRKIIMEQRKRDAEQRKIADQERKLAAQQRRYEREQQKYYLAEQQERKKAKRRSWM